MGVGLAFSVCLVTDGLAQEVGRVVGKVMATVAPMEREAVPGVTVRVPEFGLFAVSDSQGGFEFRAVPAGFREIHAELFGCLLQERTMEVRADGATEVELLVSRPAIVLSGLSVSARPSEVPEHEQAYSIGLLDLAEDRGRPARSIADVIRGEFPGVRVLSGSGLAGEEISIQVRGPHSINGVETPLVVVDGIITAAGVIDLNLSDVATVRVLRGAGGAAEYGARGAAGVIEITTRGVTSERVSVQGPLVIVDGVVSEGGLRQIDPEDIVGMELLTGTRAVALFGSTVWETGVLRVTTTAGRAGQVLERCVPAPG